MRVSVETETDPILKQLQRQFEALQKQFMKMNQPRQDDSQAKLIASLSKQQDTLLRAIEKMIGSINKKSDPSKDFGGMEKRLDKMHEALLTSSRKSRNRTFGSNY